jgi:hypothetical protein
VGEGGGGSLSGGRIGEVANFGDLAYWYMVRAAAGFDSSAGQGSMHLDVLDISKRTHFKL